MERIGESRSTGTARRAHTVVAAVTALVLVTTAMAVASPTPDGAAGGREQVIVVVDDAASPRAMAADVARRFGGTPSHVYEHALTGFAASLPAAAVAALRRDPRVRSVEPDHEVHAVQQSLPTGIRRIRTDGNATAGIGSGKQVDVDVAVLDTGIAAHSDLNLHRRVNCTTTTGSGPWQTYVCTEGSGTDGNGHGTHVAGTAAARDNDQGVVGVAPGARLWQIKVLNDTGSGSISSIIAGIDYVTSRASDIEVANMSLGCVCSSSAMNTALDNSTQAGVVYVAAAGNDNRDAGSFSPANHPRVISVGALADFDGEPGGRASPTCRADQDDTRADFSNYGSSVDIAAPGVCIRSTVPGGYGTSSGTSMASPHVAGAAALYIVANGVPRTGNRWSTVRTGLRSDGWSVAPSHACGYTPDSSRPIGRLLMVAACEGDGDPDPDPPPPTTSVSLTPSWQNNGSTWTAVVGIRVTSGGSPVGGVAVGGTWSGGGSGGGSCTTSSAGSCSVSLGGLPKRVGSVTFTVTSVNGDATSGPSVTVTR